MPEPDVAVVVPNRNGGPLLDEALRSALAQTRGDLEVVVADNGSTDGSRERAERIADPRLRVVAHDEAVGMAANWNRALRLTGARWVALLHADDVLEPTFVEVMRGRLAADPDAVAAICDAPIVDGGGRPRRPAELYRERRHDGPMTAEDYQRLLAWMTVRPCAWLARRDLLARYPFDERFTWAPDWDLWLRVLGAGERVLSVRADLARYRLHPANLSATDAVMRLRVREETAVLGAALARRPVPDRVRRRAWRNVSTRMVLAAAQVAMEGRPRSAVTMLRELAAARGPLSPVAGGAGVLAMPQLRLWLRHLVAPSAR